MPRRHVGSLASDTSADAEAPQIRLWQQMAPADKARLISELCAAVTMLARAGIRSRHPDAQPHELLVRFALLTLGPEPAGRAYPAPSAVNLARRSTSTSSSTSLNRKSRCFRTRWAPAPSAD